MINLSHLQNLVAEHLEIILDNFGLEYTKFNNYISLACPIHGGDNFAGLSILFDDSRERISWKCWTASCEESVGKDIFSFIGGIQGGDRSTGINWAKKYFNISSIQPTESNLETKSKRNYIMSVDIINKERNIKLSGMPRQFIRQSLVIPAQYFIGRGFTAEILDKYDVGFCDNPNKPMYNRVIVPIYDDDHKFGIAFMGRTVFPQCYKCKNYHHVDSQCVDSTHAKWKFSAGFSAHSYLYNYWFARHEIINTGTAVLVEGQGDIWRLEESGIHCGLGIFGTHFSDEQKILLTQSGALNVIIATDNDEAGQKAKQSLIDSLSRAYNVFTIDLPKKDVGDMSIEEVKKIFMPVLEKI